MPAVTDKRHDKRLALTLPVKFVFAPESDLSPIEGVTHNVSSGGVYFEAPTGQIEPTASLSVHIAVPGQHGMDKPNLTLIGSGIVRRVEPLRPEQVVGSWPQLRARQGIYGIAVQFQQRPIIQLSSFEQLLWEDEHP